MTPIDKLKKLGTIVRDGVLALETCPICGHTTSNIKKGATAFITTPDGGIAYKCFYCEHLGYTSNTNNALRLLGFDTKDFKIGSMPYTPRTQASFFDIKAINIDLKPYYENEKIVEFLKKRGLYDIYSKYKILDEMIYSYEDNLFYPVKYSEKVIGGRIRVMEEEKRIFTLPNIPEGNLDFMLFNADNIAPNSPIFVFEGPEDALSSGFQNSVALFGTSFKSLYNWFEGTNIVLCLDNDDAGKHATSRIERSLFNSVKVIEYKDEFGAKDFNERIIKGYSLRDNAKYIKENMVSFNKIF